MPYVIFHTLYTLYFNFHYFQLKRMPRPLEETPNIQEMSLSPFSNNRLFWNIPMGMFSIIHLCFIQKLELIDCDIDPAFSMETLFKCAGAGKATLKELTFKYFNEEQDMPWERDYSKVARAVVSIEKVNITSLSRQQFISVFNYLHDFGSSAKLKELTLSRINPYDYYLKEHQRIAEGISRLTKFSLTYKKMPRKLPTFINKLYLILNCQQKCQTLKELSLSNMNLGQLNCEGNKMKIFYQNLK